MSRIVSHSWYCDFLRPICVRQKFFSRCVSVRVFCFSFCLFLRNWMFHQFSGCKFHYPFNLFVCARARVHMLTTINNRQIVISFDKHQRQQQQQQQSSSYQMAQWQFSILICVKSNKSQMTGLKSICSTKRCAMWQSICTNETKFHNVCTSTSTATFNQTIRNQSQGWHRDDAIVIVLLCATSLLASHSLSLIPCHVTAKQN